MALLHKVSIRPLRQACTTPYGALRQEVVSITDPESGEELRDRVDSGPVDGVKWFHVHPADGCGAQAVPVERETLAKTRSQPSPMSLCRNQIRAADTSPTYS